MKRVATQLFLASRRSVRRCSEIYRVGARGGRRLRLELIKALDFVPTMGLLPINTHGVALTAVFSAFFALVGVVFVFVGLLLESLTRGLAYITLTLIGSMSLILSFMMVSVFRNDTVVRPMNQTLPPTRDRFSARERVTFFISLTVWIAIHIWARLEGSLPHSPRPLGVQALGMVIECLIGAFVTAWMLQPFFDLVKYAKNRLRRWNAAAFGDWAPEQHTQANRESTVFTKLTPSPDVTNMSRAEALTYATWCDERADQLFMMSQLLVLLGGAIVGTGIPQIIFSDSGRVLAAIVLIAGAAIGVSGLRLSHLEVNRWRMRSVKYRAYADDLLARTRRRSAVRIHRTYHRALRRTK